MRVLVVCAVDEEVDAALSRLGAPTTSALGPYAQARRVDAGTVAVHAVAGGVGEGAAATATATATALGVLDDVALVVNAGIAGGFAPRVAVGDVVIADRVVAADLGAEEPGSPGARVPLSALGYDGGVVTCDAAWVARAALASGAHVGTVLTVSTVTASAERIDDFARHHPEALAEAMEGHGVAVAARVHGVPFLEVRTISNDVGVRDPREWSFDVAFEALGRAVHSLLDGPRSVVVR